MKGFAKQFFIRGDDWVSLPQEFLLKARGHVAKLLQENPHTKVQCVLNCKMSRMIGDEEIVDEPFFHSRQKKNLGTNMEIVGEMENEKIENLENFNRGGSNWVFEKVLFLEIHFARWNPLRGSGWIALPPALQKKKALINMKNNDDMCFKWCIARAVNPVEIHPERITPQLREQAEELNWEGCKFPMAVNKIKLFESRNPQFSVNVFGWNGSVFPLKIVREEKEIHVDLLLLKTHFVLVKSFSRFLSSQVCRNGHERFFCKRCLNSFPRTESLEKHQALCNEFEATKIEVPGGICSFRNFAKMMHLPVVGYADFESILKPTRGEKGKGTVQNSRAHSLRLCLSSRFPISAVGACGEKGKRRNRKTSTRIRAGTHFQRKKRTLEFAKQKDVSPDKSRMENISRSCSLLALPKRIWRWQSQKSQGSLPFLRKIPGSSALFVQLQVSAAKIYPRVFSQSAKL